MIRLDGDDISKHGPRESLDDGIGYIPEDRSHDGYVGAFSVRENLILDLYRSDEFSRGLALQARRDREERRRTASRSSTSAPSPPSTPVSSLSGGNQQKVVVAREFSRPLKVLIASQPTRGVDVGSIEFIHKRIISERDKGTAVIIVSTELDEIFALSDRIAVMYDGRIVATVSPDIAREDIGLLMAGATPATQPEEVDRMSDRRHPAPPPGAAPEPLEPEAKADLRDPSSWLPDRQGHRRRVPDRAGHRRVRDRVQRRRTSSSRCSYFFSYPWDFFTPVGRRRSGRRTAALVKGAVGSGNAIASTLNALGAADLRRPRRDAGVPRRPVQHRRPGPADHRRDLRRLRRLHLGPAAGHPPAGRAGRRPRSAAPSGAASRASSRPAPAPTRSSPRSCSTTSAASVLLYALSHDAFQRPGSDNALSPPVDDSATFPDAVRRLRRPPRRAPRDPRRRRRLVAARAQHLGLRAARGRRQRRRLAHRRA